jgi:hypothetical protein
MMGAARAVIQAMKTARRVKRIPGLTTVQRHQIVCRLFAEAAVAVKKWLEQHPQSGTKS